MSGRPKEYDDTAVIDAAMDVFWTNGYEASSTQELCERTGLGRGSLYHAFGNKQALYEQALRRYQELGIQAQTAILNGPGSVKERLRGLLEWGVSANLENPNRGCMAQLRSWCSISTISSRSTIVTAIRSAIPYCRRSQVCSPPMSAMGIWPRASAARSS